MHPGHRAIWLAALTALLVVGLGLPAGAAGLVQWASASPGSAATRPAVTAVTLPTRSSAAPPMVGSTDRNADRIADDLARQLRRTPPDTLVPVLVAGITSARAHRFIGAFDHGEDFAILQGFAASVSPAQVRRLARVSGVTRIDSDHPVVIQQLRGDLPAHAADTAVQQRRPETLAPTPPSTPAGATPPTGHSNPTAVPTPSAPAGQTAGLCVLDTGINPAHEIFDQRAITFRNLVGHRTMGYDDHGHGTHLAGVAAYLAPRSRLFAGKVLDSFGEGRESTIIAGLEWCLSQPAVRVILTGFGGPGGDGNSVLEQAVDAASMRRVAVVAAAGNAGDRLRSVTSPGSAAKALTVGAIAGLPAIDTSTVLRDSRGVFLAPFSGRGPTLGGLNKPDVVTAGVYVLGPQAGTRDGYVSLSGTSTAAARVAGALANALSPESTQTGAQIGSEVREAAADRGPAGPDPDWGAGLMEPSQIAAAVGSAPTARSAPWQGPAHSAISGRLRLGETVDYPIIVPDTPDAPNALAATLIIAGAGDEAANGAATIQVNLELYDPQGSLLAESDCPTYADVDCRSGRQQTVGVPAAQPGTWTLRVLSPTAAGVTEAPWSTADQLEQEQSFQVEIHRGSLGSTADDVTSGP